jgi:hypothetical protein
VQEMKDTLCAETQSVAPGGGGKILLLSPFLGETGARLREERFRSESQAGTLNPHSQNWSQLQTQAHAAATDKTLDTTCRIVAAYIEWRSAERCPLHNGAIETAFREYVALKYGTS